MSNRGSISVYIHWPFCLKKCPYCDFNSYVNNMVNYKQWLTAYMNAFAMQEHFFRGKYIKSIFFGGGTPSLMEPFIVEAIISFFQQHNKDLSILDSTNYIIEEITLESNPSTFEIGKFQAFKDAGVQRISTGVQSFNEDNLKFLGRNHNARESLIALEQSNAIFERTSFDLIMGLPKQTLNDFKVELNMALPYIKEHISIYQLTIEPNTPFFKKKIPEAKEDIAVELYDFLIDTLLNVGVHQYEISNFAKRGKESIHNLNYWSGGEYIGIGPNAHGRVCYNKQWIATRELKSPTAWLNNALEMKPVIDEHQNLSIEERFEEMILTSLRVDKAIPSFLMPYLQQKNVDSAIAEGLLVRTENSIQSTRLGKACLNYLTYLLLC